MSFPEFLDKLIGEFLLQGNCESVNLIIKSIICRIYLYDFQLTLLSALL